MNFLEKDNIVRTLDEARTKLRDLEHDGGPNHDVLFEELENTIMHAVQQVQQCGTGEGSMDRHQVRMVMGWLKSLIIPESGCTADAAEKTMGLIRQLHKPRIVNIVIEGGKVQNVLKSPGVEVTVEYPDGDSHKAVSYPADIAAFDDDIDHTIEPIAFERDSFNPLNILPGAKTTTYYANVNGEPYAAVFQDWPYPPEYDNDDGFTRLQRGVENPQGGYDWITVPSAAREVEVAQRMRDCTLRYSDA